MRVLCATVAMISMTACVSNVIQVYEFPVDCRTVPVAECRPVAERAIGNLARSRPTGLIGVEGRTACPGALPDFFDPSRCWNVYLPVGPTVACMVIARRDDGVFAQAAGDQMSGNAFAPPATGVCPP